VADAHPCAINGKDTTGVHWLTTAAQGGDLRPSLVSYCPFDKRWRMGGSITPIISDTPPASSRGLALKHTWPGQIKELVRIQPSLIDRPPCLSGWNQ
jgi:hypothetical protein